MTHMHNTQMFTHNCVKVAIRACSRQSVDLCVNDDGEARMRLARRRHRKRVARIVADHWLWFARGRLMVRVTDPLTHL